MNFRTQQTLLSSIKQEWHQTWFRTIFPSFNSSIFNKSAFKHAQENENMTLDFIKKYPHLEWSYSALSSNPNITIEFILEHIDEKWDWQKLSKNPSMTPSIISGHPHLKWHWQYISRNPSIYSDESFISNNLVLIDRTSVISKMPLEFLLSRHLDYFFSEFWRFVGINPTITTSFLLNNIDKDWNWSFLSMNNAITPEFVEKYFYLPWDWRMFSCNLSLTPEFVESNLDKNWNWNNLSMNPKMIPLIREHPYLNWNWVYVSQNKGVTIEFIEYITNMIPLHFRDLSRQSSISSNDILTHFGRQDWKWSFQDMSYNENIDLSFIGRSQFQPWNRIALANNKLTNARERYFRSEWERKMKQCKEDIENELIEVAWHPDRLKWVLDEEQRERFNL